MPRILIVEDNEMNRDMLGRRLQRRGFEVAMAVDGPKGVALATSENPDLILMDISLGEGIDGWEATSQLKASPTAAHIPVIALTAHATPSDRDKSLAVGCVDFDTKPINFSRLLEKIEACFGQASSAGGGNS